MNIKERGFTVGDLIILLFIIFLSFFIFNRIKDSKSQKQISFLYQLEIIENIKN